MEIIILLLLIVLNGLFVVGEISLIIARRTRIEILSNKGDLKAKSPNENDAWDETHGTIKIAVGWTIPDEIS